MNRIEAINSFILDDDKVVDVGCDQAKLGIMLSKRKMHSIACDISENVIDIARHSIPNNKYIDLRVSNGLENVKENEVDTLVLAGMGTHTILDIIANTSLRFKKIITISNNNHDLLRNEMLKFNYKVYKEQIIFDKNKYYNLIVFDEGNYSYTEEELLFGLNHVNKDLYYEYLNYLLNKYLNIKEKSRKSNSKINNYIKILVKIVKR